MISRGIRVTRIIVDAEMNAPIMMSMLFASVVITGFIRSNAGMSLFATTSTSTSLSCVIFSITGSSPAPICACRSSVRAAALRCALASVSLVFAKSPATAFVCSKMIASRAAAFSFSVSDAAESLPVSARARAATAAAVTLTP